MDTRLQEIVNIIISALTHCHTHNIPTTFRNVFTICNIPLHLVEDVIDLDQEIVIHQESDLVIMKAMLSSKIALKV